MLTPPILEFPGRGPAIIDAASLYRRKQRIPRRVVLCFFREILRAGAERGELRLRHQLHGEGEPVAVYTRGRGPHAMTVAWPGLTAPFAAAVLEELIALGGRTFICCGGAGVLRGDIPVGTPIVVNRALRDEGTSYHYQRAGRWSRPHPLAVQALKQACRARRAGYRVGPTWTTDGLFRETRAAIRRRAAEGCLTVEMEAAALFAVARFRRVVFGQLLYAGDDVSGEAWSHRDWQRQAAARETLFQLALDACRRIPARPEHDPASR